MKLLKNKLAVTIIVLSVTFLALIAYTVKSDSKSAIESGAGSALNPVQSLMYKATNKVKETLDFFLNFSEVKAENKELVKENEKLKDTISSYADMKEENDRLKEALNYQEDKNNYTYINCEIISYSGNGYLDGYVVNKGTNDGVAKGMVVTQANGLVGKITSVGSNWCIVQSILNENIAVSVMVEGSNETGYLTGYRDRNNKDMTKVFDLPLDSEVKEGDVLLTSGVGQIYPKEIRVGEVVSVEEDKVKVMKSAIVKPYVDFNKLQELSIVVPNNTRDIKYD